MNDEITTIGQSLIQYGLYNRRVYLMELGDGDVPDIIGKLDSLAEKSGYTKVFARIPKKTEPAFEQRGYRREAFVPGFFRGVGGAAFMGKYFSRSRAQEKHPEQIHHVLVVAQAKTGESLKPKPDEPFNISAAESSDAEEMSAVYSEVFTTYPFPIHDPDYLRSTMKGHVRYFCARENGHIVALASAEMQRGARSVEMTDFATLPMYRGHQLALHLLEKMEVEMLGEKMLTAYTIARALSAGMNVTFARAGYTFAGTLTNNTNICGRIESMNVWYKRLD